MPIVHFILPDQTQMTVDAADGYSLMEIAREKDVPGIVAECGGGAICSTCHVHVLEKWLPVVGPASDTEDMLLDLAPGRDATSRLSCQIMLDATMNDLTVRVPEKQAQ
ncbi:MAG: 2Fe-2S iron-sulfur cluster binding domain-containing protein [Proteobacteria bacterium]|nr:2Fe-2S iron-sulfur cluster binding domain-containing protein [Pseudomonadota bacterium]